MPKFQIEDTEGIINYIKSLDIYTQFDEIIVIPIPTNDPMCQKFNSVEIRIKADDRLIFVHTERRLFTDPVIDLDHYFERDIKYLSASVIFGRNLVHCIDSASKYTISDSNTMNLVVVEDETAKYSLRVRLDDREIAIANFRAKFEFDHCTFRSAHEFATNKAIEIEELSDAVRSFEKLKNAIHLD